MKVHPKAQELLDQFGYLWDPYHFGFRRIRRRGEDSQQYRVVPATVLPGEVIADLGLEKSSKLNAQQLSSALAALRQKLGYLETQKKF